MVWPLVCINEQLGTSCISWGYSHFGTLQLTKITAVTKCEKYKSSDSGKKGIFHLGTTLALGEFVLSVNWSHLSHNSTTGMTPFQYALDRQKLPNHWIKRTNKSFSSLSRKKNKWQMRWEWHCVLITSSNRWKFMNGESFSMDHHTATQELSSLHFLCFHFQLTGDLLAGLFHEYYPNNCGLIDSMCLLERLCSKYAGAHLGPSFLCLQHLRRLPAIMPTRNGPCH